MSSRSYATFQEAFEDGYEAGREHERQVRDRLLTEPGIYTKIAEEMRAEREAEDKGNKK